MAIRKLELLVKLSIGFFIFAQFTKGKLVLDRIEEAYFDYDIKEGPNIPLLSEKADHINQTIAESRECPEAKEVIDTYSVWIKNDQGELSEVFVNTSSFYDEKIYITTIANAGLRWISAEVSKRPILNCLKADHSYLVRVLREELLIPPSTLPYNFTSKENYRKMGQYNQALYLENVIFKGAVRDGFFIEAGSDDSEIDSNTIFFEKYKNWTGILVEPNPTIYPLGLTKNRKSWTAPVCLGLETHPHLAQFSPQTVADGMAGLVPTKRKHSYEMQCFPLYSLILATGNRTINYLSLDIEGAELQVLKTIPWDKVDIEVISVEVNHVGEVFEGAVDDVETYLQSVGYIFTHQVGVDEFYVKKELFYGKYAPDEEAFDRFEYMMKQREVCHPQTTPYKEFVKIAFKDEYTIRLYSSMKRTL